MWFGLKQWKKYCRGIAWVFLSIFSNCILLILLHTTTTISMMSWNEITPVLPEGFFDENNVNSSRTKLHCLSKKDVVPSAPYRGISVPNSERTEMDETYRQTKSTIDIHSSLFNLARSSFGPIAKCDPW